jgi:hypothetical protein
MVDRELFDWITQEEGVRDAPSAAESGPAPPDAAASSE